MILDQHGRVARPAIRGLWEAFEGARAGGYKGWWFLPTLDTSRQMPQWTRQQVAKKNVWAYNNIGEIRAIIDGLALDEVDTAIWPKAMSSSPLFNRAVTNRFDEENKDPRNFDLRRIEHFYGAQFLIRRTIRLLGDLFGQLVRPLAPGAGPRLGIIPGYQCTSDDLKNDPAVRDGIRTDPQTGAPLQYRFALAKQTDRDPQRYTELAADDVLHFHDPFLADQTRGISTLAPVTRQMFSMDDIDRAETSGQLLRSRLAYALENVGPEDQLLPRLPGVTDTEVITNPDGSKTVIQKIVATDGSEVDVITPPSGMRVKTVESNRGGAIDFRNFIARSVAHSTLYPPEWILSLAGVQGTDVRLRQNRVQKIATFFRSNQLDPQFVYRWYIFWLWQRIKAGLFDGVPGGVPADWWKHKLLYPADMSVDVGREGNLYDSRVQRGWMSDDDYYAKSGQDPEDVEDRIIESAIRRRKKLQAALARPENQSIGEIAFEQIWLPPAGSASPPADNTNAADDNAPPPPPGASTNGHRNNHGTMSARADIR